MHSKAPVLVESKLAVYLFTAYVLRTDPVWSIGLAFAGAVGCWYLLNKLARRYLSAYVH